MKRMTGMLLMGIGLVVFLSGVFVYNKAGKTERVLSHEEQLNQMVETAAEDGVLTQRERSKIESRAKELGLDPVKHLERAAALSNDHADGSETQIIDVLKKAGDDFEGYVVKKFSRKYFNLKNWAGDKFIDGIYAETTLHPDLLLEFKLKEHSELFSVECKWRSEFKDKQMQLATPGQIKRYQKFALDHNQPVFIALGVGGKPSRPAALYMVPIADFKSNIVSEQWLEKYKLSPAKFFFYDYKNNQFSYE